MSNIRSITEYDFAYFGFGVVYFCENKTSKNVHTDWLTDAPLRVEISF